MRFGRARRITDMWLWLAVHAKLFSLFFTGLGALLALFYWRLLTETGGLPVDMQWYWQADPHNLYPHPELLQQNGYNYSPAFEIVVGWGRVLPFETFVAIWRAVLLGALVWLAGPFTIPVLLLFPVASEINAGNIQILLALAIVLAVRGGAWSAAWAFPLLTKVTPGVGILWFLLRRQWRDLAIGVITTMAIAVVTMILWPERWLGWLQLLTSGTPPPLPPFNLPFPPRFALAVVTVGIAAWRGWKWPLVVAGTLALPAFYTLSPSMLVGVLPFARNALGRWAANRAYAANAVELTPN